MFHLRPVVSIVTSHGRQQLSWERNERLSDLLRRNGVPWSAVSTYVIPRGGGDPVLRPCLDLVLGQNAELDEILLYFNRNVNPFLFSLARFKTIESASEQEDATEYFYQKLDNEQSRAEVYLKKLSPEECKSIIANRVAETIQKVIPAGSKLVVGVSGGGDSNALLYALDQLREHITVNPIIIKGIPDWDKGVPRAQHLCETYGLDLTVIEEEDVKALLGIRPDKMGLIDRFDQEFKGDDFEFVGTLLIRLALFDHARKIGAQFVCTGLNLEDLLCENFFRTSNGMDPAGVPLRTIGDITMVFPLWLCPKRILDGCFPKFSRENYDARYPCFSLGRNLYYSLVYSVQSEFPGFVEQWAQGFSDQSAKHPITYTFDEQLGFHIERAIPLPLRHRFQKMLSR